MKTTTKVYFIQFQYTDDGGDFSEHARLTVKQAHDIKERLVAAQECGLICEGYYIGPPQNSPSGFIGLSSRLDQGGLR